MIIGHAKQGDLFMVTGTNGNWYEVELVGRLVYIHHDYGETVTQMTLARPPESTRRAVFQGVLRAETRATELADSAIPTTSPASLSRNSDLMNRLADRGSLLVLRRYDVQPVHSADITTEGLENGWAMQAR